MVSKHKSRNEADRALEHYRHEMHEGVPPWELHRTFLVQLVTGGAITARWSEERLLATRDGQEVGMDDVVAWLLMEDDPFVAEERGIYDGYHDEDVSDRANAAEELRWHGHKNGGDE